VKDTIRHVMVMKVSRAHPFKCYQNIMYAAKIKSTIFKMWPKKMLAGNLM